MKSVRKKVNVMMVLRISIRIVNKSWFPVPCKVHPKMQTSKAFGISALLQEVLFVKPKLGIKAIIHHSCSQIVGLFLYKELFNEFRGC